MATRNKRRKGNSVSVDLSGVESTRKAIPEGTYSVVVNKAELKDSQSGNPMIALEFEVDQGTHKGVKLYENCSLQPQALFKLKAVLQGLGFPIPKGNFNLDADELVGMSCEVEVGNEIYEGKKKSRILEYLIPGEEDDEGEEDDGEDLEDQLSEMSLKELKDLASELDISPSKVKKAKNASSLKKLILEEAEEDDILAALGEDDEEEEDEEEEDEDDESPDYSEMSLKELKAECKDRGLRVKKGMDKEDLIELLEEDDQE